MVGRADQPPLLILDPNGVPQGYGILVGERVAQLLSEALRRPVRLNLQTVSSDAQIDQQLSAGGAELACGLPFSWARDQILDHSMPIFVSGLRLMAPEGRFSGDPAGLAGRSIGVVGGSLAESDLRGTQPAARIVTFPDLAAALRALGAGQVEGVVGDSLLLRARAQQLGLTGMVLTPRVPYERYSVTCVVPENSSAFLNVVNRAIVQMQQGYLEADPATVTLVNRWLGPGSGVNLPPEIIRTVFDLLLTGVETIRPLSPVAAP